MRSSDLLHHIRKHFLGHIHEVVVVGIGLVELTSSELGVVREIDALVTELTSDFIHPIQSTHHKLFKVELGSNAHVEVHAQIVVIGHKGTCHGTSRNHVHHWCLNLHKVSFVEVLSNVVDNLRTNHEGITHIRIHDKVKVPLSVSRLLIRDAAVMSSHRKHMQTGTEQFHVCGKNTQLTLLALSGMSRDSHHVSPTKRPMNLVERVLPGRI
mmetsp:Transcript_39818/g.93317  ORF Transcript_39818/g.93317 Transcript_39818/m.93317 type:complete len:211 (-) Transcript_39818:590-1222(-)